MAKECLKVLSGDLEGKTYQIDGTLTIGRSPNTDVQPDDPLISRKHCRIVQTPNGTWLRDLASVDKRCYTFKP